VLAQAAMPGSIAVASVNHGLREEAAGEVGFVERVCTALGVPFTALSVELRGGNVQARAREARYAALSTWLREEALGALATAHHADDQAETLLMRLSRGSGLSGLAGVRAASPFYPGDGGEPFPLLRPLLDWRKHELEAIVSASGLTPVRDPSNTQSRFDRVRIRKHLAEHEWMTPESGYGLADMATYPWMDARQQELHGVDIAKFPNVAAWIDKVEARPGVQRGMAVLKEDMRVGNPTEETKKAFFNRT